MKISIIGLGKLGACTLACFAEKGHEVHGIDINKNFVDLVGQGKAPVQEPDLDEMLSRNVERITTSQNFADAIEKTDITLLIVPTPSKPNGHFTDKYLCDALLHLSQALKKSEKENHVFVITSTVSPGTCSNSLIPLIEKESGRKLGEGFSVCYNPEFIALGSVIKDFLNPDLILIGESDEIAGKMLADLYEPVCKNNPRVARMSLVSAEITKISLNSYVTMKISFANTLANICENMPGSNIDDITSAIGADKRVSPYYLKGGLSFGGPCFPRDNRAFSAFAQDVDIDAKLAKATDGVNAFQIENLCDRVVRIVEEKQIESVSILGLSYKPNTPVIEESPGIVLAETLLSKKDIEIIVYDNCASDNARSHFSERVMYASSVDDCVQNSQLCIIALFSDEFFQVGQGESSKNLKVIVDCWRILDPEKIDGNISYIPVGKHCND